MCSSRVAAIAGRIDRELASAFVLFERLVNAPSPSGDHAAIAAALQVLGSEYATLGMEVEASAPGPAAPYLVARTAGCTGPHILLVGHVDTVLAPTPGGEFHRHGSQARGPGVADMKGGLAIMVAALRALRERLAQSEVGVTVFIAGDEEIGSPNSRKALTPLCRDARAALIYEGARHAGDLVVERSGVGQAHMRIEGLGAHAGVCPEAGASAVVELAHQVLAVQTLAAAHSTRLNIGFVNGGHARNTVPATATMAIDIRYTDPIDASEVLGKLERLASESTVRGTSVVLEVSLHRPPMASQQQTHLCQLAVQLGHDLASPLVPSARSGASDGNLTASAQVPTLDALGIVGGDWHTRDEWCDLTSVRPRALLSACLIDQLLSVESA